MRKVRVPRPQSQMNLFNKGDERRAPKEFQGAAHRPRGGRMVASTNSDGKRGTSSYDSIKPVCPRVDVEGFHRLLRCCWRWCWAVLNCGYWCLMPAGRCLQIKAFQSQSPACHSWFVEEWGNSVSCPPPGPGGLLLQIGHTPFLLKLAVVNFGESVQTYARHSCHIGPS